MMYDENRIEVKIFVMETDPLNECKPWEYTTIEFYADYGDTVEMQVGGKIYRINKQMFDKLLNFINAIKDTTIPG